MLCSANAYKQLQTFSTRHIFHRIYTINLVHSNKQTNKHKSSPSYFLNESIFMKKNIEVQAKAELILMRPSVSIPPPDPSIQGKAFVSRHSSLFLVAKQDLTWNSSCLFAWTTADFNHFKQNEKHSLVVSWCVRFRNR